MTPTPQAPDASLTAPMERGEELREGVWYCHGTTLFTLKEKPGRYHDGKPLLVNRNSFQVQGPDAEAVAEQILRFLSPAPTASGVEGGGEKEAAVVAIIERAPCNQGGGLLDAERVAGQIVAALAQAPAAQAQTVPKWPAGYQESFDAIGKAVTWHPHAGLSISVRGFYRALAYPDAPTAPTDTGQGEALREALGDVARRLGEQRAFCLKRAKEDLPEEEAGPDHYRGQALALKDAITLIHDALALAPLDTGRAER